MIPDITAFIFLIGGLQGLMLASALMPIAKQHSAHKYLILLVGMLSVDTLSQLLYWGGLHEMVPHLLGLTMFFPAFYGPLFYLYVNQLLRPATLWRWKIVLFFLAPIVSYSLNVQIFFLSGAEKAELVETIQLGEMPRTFVIGTMFMLSSFGFVISAIVRLRHDRMIGIRSHWIDWVWIMSIFQSVIWAIVLLNLFTPFRLTGAPYMLVSLMIYVLGYKALFAERPKPESQLTQALTEKEKYGEHRLDSDLQSQIWIQLEQQLIGERLFTNPELRVADLAAKTGFQTHLVSQVINACRSQNFNELVNELRINESKRLLLAEPNMSIQAVMEASGFQAKSTFNTLFKQAVGQTPTVFRKQGSSA